MSRQFVKSALLALFVSPFAVAGPLSAGFAKVDITPKPQVDKVYTIHAGEKTVTQTSDPLAVKALVLSDGDQQVALVATDLIWVKPELQQAIVQSAKQQFGLAHVILTLTHSHSGTYNQAKEAELQQSILTSIQRAGAQMIPVEIGATSVQVDETYNRILNKNGKAEMLWSNPKRLSSPPNDQSLDIIRLQDKNGNPLVTLVNYSAHPVVTMDLENVVVSADYPGELANYLSSVEQGESMFMLGAGGDINPYEADSKPLAQALNNSKKLGIELGQTVHQAASEITSFQNQASFRLVTHQFSQPQAQVGVLQLTDDIALAHFPGEYFNDFAVQLKRGTGIRHTLFVSMANGYLGYVPTNEALKIGGYGTGKDEGVGMKDIGDAHVRFAIEALRKSP